MYNVYMEEIWKQIDDTYSISSWGRFKGPRGITKGSIGTKGYMQVSMYRKTKNVHVLVAQAFLGDRPENMHVCHKDGDKTNNTLANLRYDTPANNWQDFREQDRVTTHAIARTHCPLGHELTEQNIMPSQAKRGWRSCLACSRAHAYIRNGKNKEITDHKQLADIYYERLLSVTN